MFLSPGSRPNRKRTLLGLLTKYGIVYGGGANASPSATAALAAGQFIVGGSTVPVLPATAKLSWDNTNFRLGIGNASPANALDLVGDSIAVTNANGVAYFMHGGNTAIRDDFNGSSTMYLDIAAGGATSGVLEVRTSNAFSRILRASLTTLQIPALTNGLLSADGSGNITAAAATGGMTLLGTLTTTSGTTQTLSSLTLTSYKWLFCSLVATGFTASVNLTLGGQNISNGSGAKNWGNVWVDLNNSGLATSNVLSAAAVNAQSTCFVASTGYTTASTSIQFAGGTFNNGSILVYGVK